MRIFSSVVYRLPFIVWSFRWAQTNKLPGLKKRSHLTLDHAAANTAVKTKIKLPAKACGDICLIPVNAAGEELKFTHPGELAEVDRVLSPHPTHDQLQTLAGLDKVIYVAVGYQSDDRRHPQPPAPRPGPHSKYAITQAILQQSLAGTCILGATLAYDLLHPPKRQDYKS